MCIYIYVYIHIYIYIYTYVYKYYKYIYNRTSVLLLRPLRTTSGTTAPKKSGDQVNLLLISSAAFWRNLVAGESTQISNEGRWVLNSEYTHICLYICTHTHQHTHTHRHTHTQEHTRIYICIYICMYIYVHFNTKMLSFWPWTWRVEKSVICIVCVCVCVCVFVCVCVYVCVCVCAFVCEIIYKLMNIEICVYMYSQNWLKISVLKASNVFAQEPHQTKDLFQKRPAKSESLQIVANLYEDLDLRCGSQ